jgi:hypothetical protein
VTGWRYYADRLVDLDVHYLAKDCIGRCRLDAMPYSCIDVCGAMHDQVRKEKQHRSCTGFRKEVQEQVVNQVSLREALVTELGRWLVSFDPAQRGLPATFGPDQDWALVLYCKSGRHRSVACACLLQACLEFLGWTVTLHLGATDLSPTCKGLCDRCNGPNVKSAMALNRMWTALRPSLPTALLPGPVRQALVLPDRPGIAREPKRPRL